VVLARVRSQTRSRRNSLAIEISTPKESPVEMQILPLRRKVNEKYEPERQQSQLHSKVWGAVDSALEAEQKPGVAHWRNSGRRAQIAVRSIGRYRPASGSI